MTADGTSGGVEFPWTAATLKAARKQVGLTQERLADLAKIDRSRYNGLERGHKRLTPTYAERLAPHLRKQVGELLQPEAGATDPEDPYALLRRLAETVEKQQTTIEVLQTKVEALERVASKRRRANVGGR